MSLGETCSIARGGSPRPIQAFLTDAADGINWVKISDATASSKYIFSTAQKIKPTGVSRSRVVREGDFLLSNSMSFGRPYIMRTTGCIHDGWLVLSDYEGSFDQDFLYLLLGSHQVYRQFDRLAAGSTVRNLNIDLARRVLVPVPPISEQQRIVAILDEALEGIATAKTNAEKNLQHSRELFECFLQSLFSERAPDWTERTLEDVCEISSKLVDPREPKYLDLPHIGAGNIESKSGALVDVRTARDEQLISGKFLFDEGVVLYSKIRPYLMKVVRPAFSGICSADIYPLVPKSGCIDRDFLYYLLLTSAFTEYAIKGSARAGMPKVNREHLFAYRSWMPSIQEQTRLAARLDALVDEIHRLAEICVAKLAALDELKQSLLTQAFTGALTDKAVDKQVAEVA